MEREPAPTKQKVNNVSIRNPYQTNFQGEREYLKDKLLLQGRGVILE